MATRNPTYSLPGSAKVTLTGTTPVVIISAPPTSAIGSDFKARRVTCLRIPNLDNALVTVILRRSMSGEAAEFFLKRVDLAVAGAWVPADNNNEINIGKGGYITAELAAPANSIEPIAYVEYEDTRFQN